MLPTIPERSAVKLSICIPTFNRAAFIGATLESIIAQATNECEIVVLDGASTDNTEQVVSVYRRQFDRFRYVRQDVNNGFDRDCDRAVELAVGEYCWLMTDDDLVKPGAVAAVLDAVRLDLSLVIVNVEDLDFTMSTVLQPSRLPFQSNRLYGPDEMDRLFVEAHENLPYVGAIIIKRAIWLARERERYYGSSFVYLGVIFQECLPGGTLVIAEPLISYRRGNTHSFSSKMFEIFMVRWPSLVSSLALGDETKNKFCGTERWRSLQELLLWRGWGFYTLTEYQQYIRPRLRSVGERFSPLLVALLPGMLVNALFVFYYSTTRRRYRRIWQPEVVLNMLRESRFHFRNWRVLGAKSGLGE